MAQGRGILKYLHALCFPERCIACRTLLDWQTPYEYDGTRALCDKCMQAWISDTVETCGVCARRVGDCFCMTSPMYDAKIDGFCKLIYYMPRKRTPVQNRIIYAIKRRDDRKTLDFLADALAATVRIRLSQANTLPEDVVITHLPRSRRAVLLYGTDQAKALGEAMSAVLGVPHVTLIRRRRGIDREQKKLSLTAREKNAKSAFLPVAQASCRGKTVLLVDDVVTTGAGMAACARILRKMGVARIIAVAIASDAINRDVGKDPDAP